MGKGHDESSASAICTTSLQEAGEPIFEGLESGSDEEIRALTETGDDDGVRHLHLCAATGKARIEAYEGREHIVVPVVALMEEVIHAVNADVPEFVPLDTLRKAAASWNGRPVMLGHPVKNGRQCSANAPDVIAASGIGTIFNSRIEGKRLLQEAWIDKAKAKRLHPKLHDRLLANEPVEVSVGAHVITGNVESTYNGKPYKSTWLEASGDHLAFLPDGRGACSMEMGCGALRAASYRVEDDALVALGAQIGHPFFGNQHTDAGEGGKGKDAGKGKDSGDGIKSKDADSKLRSDVGPVKKKMRRRAKGKAVSAAKAYEPKRVRKMSEAEKNKEAQRLAKDAAKEAEVPEEESEEFEDDVKQAVIGEWKKEKYTSEAPLRIGECAHLDTIRTLFDEAETLLDEASDYVDQLVDDDAAGSETDVSKLEALETLAMSVSNALNSVISLTYRKRAPHIPAMDSPKYAEEFRAAVGKAISAKNLKVIQASHDAAHSMHDHTTALGAACDAGWKWLAGKALGIHDLKIIDASSPTPEELQRIGEKMITALAAKAYKDCVACDGTGSKDGNPCEACDGTGRLKKSEERAAEDLDRAPAEKAAAEEAAFRAACRCQDEGGHAMTKEQRDAIIGTLVKSKHSGFTAGDEKMLEGASDERLESFRVAAEARAQEEEKLRAAASKQLTAEEFMAAAPPELRSLIDRQQRQETELKAALINELRTAQSEFSVDELSVKPLDELQRMARMVKVDTARVLDYSGRGLAVSRAAEAEDYTPPDPYAPALKAMQERRAN